MKRYAKKSQSGSHVKYRHVRHVEQQLSDSGNTSSDGEVELAGFINTACNYEQFTHGISRQFTSSPIHFLNESSNTDLISDGDTDSDDDSELLYAGAKTSLNAFASNYLQQVTKFKVSDVASDAILRVFRDALPTRNACPTFYSVKKANDVDGLWKEVKHHDGTFYLLNVEEQIKHILSAYPQLFDLRSDYSSDILNSQCFTNFDTDDKKHVYIILNVDGISPTFSSRHHKMWAVMGSVVNLPAELRIKFENIIFCCLFYGHNGPDFNFVMSTLVDHLQSVRFRLPDFVVELKIITLCADMPAKAKCTNMTQFNGYYGCPFCLCKGTYNNASHKLLYRIEDGGCLRSVFSHMDHAKKAEIQKAPVFGVKGFIYYVSSFGAV